MKDKVIIGYTDDHKIYLEIEANTKNIEIFQDNLNPDYIGIMMPLATGKKIFKDLKEAIANIEKSFS